MSQQFRHIGAFAEEFHAARDSQFACQPFQLRSLGSVADQLQLQIGDLVNGDRDRLQQRREVLLGGESCDGDRDGRGDRSRIREVTEVDAVPNASHLASGNTIGLNAESRGVIRDGDNAIDEMTGPAKLRARLPAVTGPLTVSRVDDDRHTSQSCGEARVQMRVGVVRVNDIEAARAEQFRHLSHETDAAGGLQ